MGIVSPRPESGVRIDLERPAAGGPPWRYDGTVATPTGEFSLRARVTEDGAVTMETPSQDSPALPAGVEQKAKLLLRAAWKHADADGAPPPRRIVRWRA
jgi:hypothetical protein